MTAFISHVLAKWMESNVTIASSVWKEMSIQVNSKYSFRVESFL